MEENRGDDQSGRGPSPPPPLPSRRSLPGGPGGEAFAGSPGGAGTGGKLESFVGFGRPPGRMSPRYETPPGTPPPPYFGDNQEVRKLLLLWLVKHNSQHPKSESLCFLVGNHLKFIFERNIQMALLPYT